MKIRVLTHSSIKIEAEKIIYCDPYLVNEEYKDGDIVLITHDHHDHFSKEDVLKVINEDTLIICPEAVEEMAKEVTNNVLVLGPEGFVNVDGVDIETVRAYNVGKQFHTKDKNYLGYILTLEGKRIYIAGDTDENEDNLKVNCDIALIPVGGKYTMDYKAASEFVNKLKPELAIPTHYGSVAGNDEDAVSFKELVDKDIKVEIIKEY